MTGQTRTIVALVALVLVLVAAAAAALLVGAAETTSAIITEIRAPRIALTLIVGAGLGLSGALLQGTLRNPLADPGIIGVSASAALGAVVAVALGAAYSSWLAAIGATVAGIAGMALVLWIARSASGRTEVVTVVLGGVAVTAFMAAVLSIVITVSEAAGARSVTFWTTGSLALATWPGVWSTLPFLILATILAIVVARDLDVLALGDRAAWAAGIDVERTRVFALGAAVLAVSAGVAVVGVIAFVGLVVPHAVRMLIGPRHGGLLIGSALAGALLLLVSDTIARTAASPVEVPLGVITAVIGAPVFILLLRRTRAAQGGWA
ncbi:MAG: iron ABC transporter permease [Actinobacteria bacterium]|nr:iron ABC transporter permease [Actinomycetota bacterium]